jgi:hypothetical protein
MFEVVVVIGVFGVSLTLLSLGVIFRKRTPLKAACGSAVKGKMDRGVCDSCTCGNVSPGK